MSNYSNSLHSNSNRQVNRQSDSKGLSGLSDGNAVMAEQIVCEARKTLVKGLTCAQANSRFGIAVNSECCATTAWGVVEDAALALKCSNFLTKTAVAKSLYTTSVALANRDFKNYGPGDVFVCDRINWVTRQPQPNASADWQGHSGIVLEVTASGIKVAHMSSDLNNGIFHEATFTKAEIALFKMYFIHPKGCNATKTVGCDTTGGTTTPTTPVAGCTESKPVARSTAESIQFALSGGWRPNDPKLPRDTANFRYSAQGCWRLALLKATGQGSGDPNTPPSDSSVNPCKNSVITRSCCDGGPGATVLMIPTTEQVPHFSVIKQDERVAYAMYGGSFADSSEETKDLKDGFPMLRDNNGNRFIFTIESYDDTGTPNVGSHHFYESLGLFGPNPTIFRADRFSGDQSWKTGNAYPNGLGRMLLPPGHSNRKDVSGLSAGSNKDGLEKEKRQLEDKLRGYVNPTEKQQIQRRVTQINELLKNLNDTNKFYGFARDNWWDSMAAIENAGTVTNQTFVFMWSGVYSGFKLQDIAQLAVSAASFALTYVGLPASVIGPVSGILGKIVSGGTPTIQELFALTEVMLPEEYGAKGKNYVGKALNIADKFYKKDYIGFTKSLATELNGGEVPAVIKGIEKEFKNFELLAKNAAADIQKYAQGNWDQVRKVVHGYAGHVTGNNLLALAGLDPSSSALFQSIITDNLYGVQSIVKSPVLREFLTLTGTTQQMGVLPNAASVVKGIFSIESIFKEDVRSAEEHMALGALAAGRKIKDGMLDRLQLNALLAKAEEFKKDGLQFTMPPVFDQTQNKEKGECFAREIEICVGIRCCAPKQMFNGACYDPKDIPTDTPPTDNPGGKLPGGNNPGYTLPGGGTPGGFSPVNNPPQQFKLPDCIRLIQNEYFYCPPATCGTSRTSLPATTPIQRNEPIAVTPQRGSILPYSPVQNSRPVAAVVEKASPSHNVVSPSTTQLSPVLQQLQNSIAKVQQVTIEPHSISVPQSYDIAPPPGYGLPPRPAADPAEDYEAREQRIIMEQAARNEQLAKSIPRGILQPASASFSTTLTPMPTSVVNAALNDDACTTIYRAFVQKQGTPLEKWYAEIGGKIVELIDCCAPQSSPIAPPQGEECCEETQARLSQIMTKIQELLLRNASGENTPACDIGSIETQIASLRSEIRNIKIPAQQVLDLSTVTQQLSQMMQLLQTISLKNSTPYDDRNLVARMEEMMRLIRTQSGNTTIVQGSDTSALENELRITQANFQHLQETLERNMVELRSSKESQPDSYDSSEYDELRRMYQEQTTMYEARIRELQNQLSQKSTTGTTEKSQQTSTKNTKKGGYSTTIGSGSKKRTSLIDTDDCPDCPKVIERHERVIYNYPTGSNNQDDDCQDC